MKDMTEMKNQIDCINDWIKRKDSGISKAAFCREWNTSPRSLGRWMDKFQVHVEPTIATEDEIKIGDKVKVVCTNTALYDCLANENIRNGSIHTVTCVGTNDYHLDDLVAGWVRKEWVEKVSEGSQLDGHECGRAARKLKASFTCELQHDLRQIHGLDEETELINSLSIEEPQDDYQYIISNVSAMITKNGETAIIHRESPNYKAVVDLLLNEDFENAWHLTSIKKAIETFSQGKIKVEGDKVFYGTFEVRNRMTDKLIDMVSKGEEGTKAFCSFFEAVMTDIESDHVRDQLWPFIESQCIELNDDGTFTGYRAVRSDYLDKHTGTIDNSVGQVVVMPRHMVNSDPNQACSAGLHVGSLEYAKGFSGGSDRLMKVKCHVRDVVSVPYDYNSGKLRCCRFEVIEDITNTI